MSSSPGGSLRRHLTTATALALFASVAVLSQLQPPVVSAAADANLVPLVAARLLDTRSANGETVDGQHEKTGKLLAGTSYTLPVAGRGGTGNSIADDADAVMLNVTAVLPDGLGYLTVYPCTDDVPNASHVNYFPGQVVPNSVLAKVSDEGTVCVFTLATTDVIVDVTGYVPIAGAPVPVDPSRLVETRDDPNETTVDGQFQAIGRATAGSTVEFTAAGRADVPADAEAVYLNVTAIFPSAGGFLTVYPCGSPRPETSNVNYGPGEVQPNAVLASVGDDGKVCIFTLAEADIIADVNAYIPPGGNREKIEPARCADTRPEGETFDGLFEGDGKIEAGGTYKVQIAGRCNIQPSASAVYMNVTAVNTEAAGFLTVWPCDQPRPNASNVNYGPGQISPNAVLSKVSLDGNGEICIFSLARTDVIVDVNGFVPEPGLFGIKQIAPGNRTTCALMSDDTVRCAGDAGYVGNGENEDEFDPVPVVGLTDVVELENADSHTCAIKTDRTLWCWGSNGNGQLGDGTNEGVSSFPKRLTPVQTVGLTGVLDVSAHDTHTCAITDDDDDDNGDTVWCWGRNNYNQTGEPSGDSQLSPFEVPGLPSNLTPVEVAAGNLFSCVRYDDGTVWCWGQGGRVGRDVNGSAAQEPMAAEVTNVVQLEAGGSHTCARIDDGTVECWGLNEDDALGNRDGAVESVVPSPVLGVTGVVDLTVGEDATCVGFADDTYECWGDNGRGQLGRLFASDNEINLAPMNTERAATIVEVTINDRHACALLNDSSAVCWGYNPGSGNLGVRLIGDAISPVVYGSGDLRPA